MAEGVFARNHAGDAEQKRRSLEFLGTDPNRVLENARICTGEVVLDVGAGDGLIAFGAMPLVGESGRVVFCDDSQDLLDHSQTPTGGRRTVHLRRSAGSLRLWLTRHRR